MIALVNCKIFVGDGGYLDEAALIIKGDRIVGYRPVDRVPKRIRCVDMQGLSVAPGFIDLLANGAGGGSFGVTADYNDLLRMADTMVAEGTTGFLAAAPSNSLELYQEMQRQMAAHQDKLPKNLLGIHLEGPYLSREFRGAHPENYVRDCSDDELHALLDKESHFISMMTVAPERINADQLSYLNKKGVKVSFGHSGVSYDEALRFFESTGCNVTHMYNGMPPMHHRQPGHIPAIFHAKPLTGIIVDGEHVAYPVVKMSFELMRETIYLFTDRFTDCPAMGVHHGGEHNYFVRTAPDGTKTMCGSALTMMKAVRNCVEQVGIPLKVALQMASYRPAKVLGIEHEVGLLDIGYKANIVAFDDNWQMQRVMLEGKWIK